MNKKSGFTLIEILLVIVILSVLTVGSIFGSSQWIHKNFGNTKACCDYTIVDANNQSLDGLIQLQ